MSRKTKICAVLNIIFLTLVGYALWIFYQAPKSFNAQELIENSHLKEKTFHKKVEEITSLSGLKAYFMEDSDTSVASLSFYFDNAGYIYSKEGLATLTSEVLLNGAGKYHDEEFNDLLELHGISLSFDVSDETFNGEISFPVQYEKLAASILKSVLTEPLLEEKYIDITKRQMMTALQMQEENPQKILSKAFKKEFFGSHPKSRDALGSVTSVNELSKQDIKDFISSYFSKNNLKIAIAGSLNSHNAKEFIDEAFGSLQNQKKNSEEIPLLQADYHFKDKHIFRNIPQIITLTVAPATTRLSNDFYPLYMANEIFGGADLTSRLNVVAREKEGLTYGAYTSLNTDIDAPRLMGQFSTSVQNQNQMYEVFLQEWNKMALGTITQTELDEVKENMLTSFNLRFTSTAAISSMLLYMQKENLGIDFLQKRNDYVKSVTLDDINRVSQKYYKTKPSFITIGKENERND